MIRTRFAPSPTGELHIGGARTALFNFLFARSAGGRFVLRIDDTDAERSRREYEVQLMDDLQWLGLTWDEGPYRQSERGSLYVQCMADLRERDAVYPCFCSEERLAALREEQLARGQPPRYDGRCRDIPPGEAERRMAARERVCWRLALPEDYSAAFDDIARGPQAFPAGTIGDFVLQRSDGSPTYLFASAVDDELMGITHVIRGDEHIPNTARQLALIDRMGWSRPAFAHIPMVLSMDRRKLSKRTGSQPIQEYRRRGVLPEALTAYLATLSWTPPEGADPFDLSSLAGVFSLGEMARSSPVHDEGHLLHWQREAMTRRGGERLAAELAASDPRLAPYGGRLAPLIEDLIGEAPSLPELQRTLVFLVQRPDEGPDAPRESWMPDLGAALIRLVPWTTGTVEGALRSFMKGRDLKGREFFHPLRLRLTGKDQGAPLPLILFALGPEGAAARLQ